MTTSPNRSSQVYGLLLGVGIGAALGVALDSIALGVALGAGIGLVFVGAFRGRRHDKP